MNLHLGQACSLILVVVYLLHIVNYITEAQLECMRIFELAACLHLFISTA